ncbi:hypothetical protein THASP1DRAFT_21886 [Thamnocephalis sphaerospora]|uniref:F-box domain-containing protein n=1 Tax=Thamnocephalis sphaerospora TaxID=78915 RepID=A0A4P9XYA5_9FUNG|nr:hypothetical protein THASP1DRAFT_21886 [Thamnocephalis sphaerospora]|eukprot:RKP10410.1 hypothetical protein THASP1DRAFT_21886 [Thamnocephalis sphaerospora]
MARRREVQRPSLPLEVLDNIARQAEHPVLPRLARVSRLCRDAALPWLYHTLAWTTVTQMRQYLSLMARRWSELAQNELTGLLLRCANMSEEEEVSQQMQRGSAGKRRRGRLNAEAHHRTAMARGTNATKTSQPTETTALLSFSSALPMSTQMPLWMPRIQCLDLSWTSLNGRPLCMLLSQCQSTLRELSVARCAIGDMIALAISTWCPLLERLDFSYTNVTNEGLHELARGNHNLRWLSLKGCELVTDEAVVALRAACPKLRWLDLSDCYGILFADQPLVLASQSSQSTRESADGSQMGTADDTGVQGDGHDRSDEGGWVTEDDEDGSVDEEETSHEA